MAEEYEGLVGAFRFALSESESWLFRTYVVVSAVIGVLVALLLLLALVTWIARPSGRIGERALIGVLLIFILAPLFAPVLIVARRHRFHHDHRGVDLGLGIAGYVFVGSLYVGILISDPARHSAPGVSGIVVRALDDLPDTFGLLPPAIGVVLMAIVALLTRPRS